jgi:hypothetical protein
MMILGKIGGGRQPQYPKSGVTERLPGKREAPNSSNWAFRQFRGCHSGPKGTTFIFIFNMYLWLMNIFIALYFIFF